MALEGTYRGASAAHPVGYHEQCGREVEEGDREGADKAKSGKEVVVEAHEVDLAHGSQSLLLRQLAGPACQLEALGSHPHRPT